MSMPLYGARGFQEERERHGATVTDTTFGRGGLLAVAGSKEAGDEQETRANQDFERQLAAPRPPARGAGRNTSPMDSWLDHLPFRGAEVWTLVPCDASGRGVSVSIRATGAKAPEVIAGARESSGAASFGCLRAVQIAPGAGVAAGRALRIAGR